MAILGYKQNIALCAYLHLVCICNAICTHSAIFRPYYAGRYVMYFVFVMLSGQVLALEKKPKVCEAKIITVDF